MNRVSISTVSGLGILASPDAPPGGKPGRYNPFALSSVWTRVVVPARCQFAERNRRRRPVPPPLGLTRWSPRSKSSRPLSSSQISQPRILAWPSVAPCARDSLNPFQPSTALIIESCLSLSIWHPGTRHARPRYRVPACAIGCDDHASTQVKALRAMPRTFAPRFIFDVSSDLTLFKGVMARKTQSESRSAENSEQKRELKRLFKTSVRIGVRLCLASPDRTTL